MQSGPVDALRGGAHRMNPTLIEAALFRRRRSRWIVVSLALIAGVGIGDYVTGSELTFSVFYLIPVAAAAWLSGTRSAVAASIFAAAVWLWADYLSARVDTSAFVYGWNFCARLLFLVLVAVLLARLRDMLDRERELSRTDGLTGLLNARAFREVAEAEIARSQRYGQPLSLAFIDVDNFKGVNDSRGHAAGDHLLTCLAGAMRGNLRRTDVVARYGGDEFVALLPHADENAARAAVEKLLAKVDGTMKAAGWPVTLSIGVVTWRSGQTTVDAMVETADRLMYEVKLGTKNGVRYATCGGS